MKTYEIEGMTCQGCVESLTQAIQQRLEETSVEVRLSPGQLELPNRHDPELVRQAVEAAGFSIKTAT